MPRDSVNLETINLQIFDSLNLLHIPPPPLNRTGKCISYIWHTFKSTVPPPTIWHKSNLTFILFESDLIVVSYPRSTRILFIYLLSAYERLIKVVVILKGGKPNRIRLLYFIFSFHTSIASHLLLLLQCEYINTSVRYVLCARVLLVEYKHTYY